MNAPAVGPGAVERAVLATYRDCPSPAAALVLDSLDVDELRAAAARGPRAVLRLALGGARRAVESGDGWGMAWVRLGCPEPDSDLVHETLLERVETAVLACIAESRVYLRLTHHLDEAGALA